MSVLAQDYPSAPANPSSLAKRDARGLRDKDVTQIRKTNNTKEKK